MLNPTLNFCTLFNANYLTRGLVMYDSLKKNCNNFHLFVFAFDNRTLQYLRAQNFKDLTVISLEEFEDEALLSIKNSRTATEYCWTCTPSTILYCIKRFSLQNCIYIDADLMFYADPLILFEEMGQKSVLITEHRYTQTRDLSEGSGKYCVQFMVFKNDQQGLNVLNWWREACIDWCYARYEAGKFGDQKYLDDWTTRFAGIHELQHLGGGLAPWNIQQYNFFAEGEKIQGVEISSGKAFEAVFYHFHELKFYKNNIVSYTGANYGLTKTVKQLFYEPYINLLMKKRDKINSFDNSFDPNGSAGNSPMEPLNLFLLLKFYLYDLKASVRNMFTLNFTKRIDHHHYHKIKA